MFQRKLVVFCYMGQNAPSKFTRKEHWEEFYLNFLLMPQKWMSEEKLQQATSKKTCQTVVILT